MNNLRLIASVFAVVTSVAAVGCTDDNGDVVIDPGPDSSLRVQNQSDFSIVELRVTSVGSSTWGPNLLGNDDLRPDESITLGVVCDRYDALLVDEDGVDCEVHDLDLCLNDATWVIHNNTCSVFGAAKAAREAAAAAAKANTGSAASTPDVGSAK
jgi:hypothetical protein